MGVNKAKWYPFDQFIELNVTIDRLFGTGDRKLIRGSAATAPMRTSRRSTGCSTRSAPSTGSWVARSGCGARTTTPGFLEVATRGPKAAILRVRSFPTPHPRTAWRSRLGGTLGRALGRQAPDMAETKCRNRGDDLCQYEITWD